MGAMRTGLSRAKEQPTTQKKRQHKAKPLLKHTLEYGDGVPTVTIKQSTTTQGDASSSLEVVRLMSDLQYEDRELFYCLQLNAKNRILSRSLVSIGTLTSSLIHPREVFKAAILSNAAAIICVHNHPSGDPTPSHNDRLITERIEEAGEIIGITLLDHIIIGANGSYTSLKNVREAESAARNAAHEKERQLRREAAREKRSARKFVKEQKSTLPQNIKAAEAGKTDSEKHAICNGFKLIWHEKQADHWRKEEAFWKEFSTALHPGRETVRMVIKEYLSGKLPSTAFIAFMLTSSDRWEFAADEYGAELRAHALARLHKMQKSMPAAAAPKGQLLPFSRAASEIVTHMQ